MIPSLKYRIEEFKKKWVHQKNARFYKVDYLYYQTVLKQYHSLGGLKHDFQLYKLYELNKILQLFQPRSILEFGSGSTTSILVHYLRKQNNHVFLKSVDENQEWLEKSKSLCHVDQQVESIEFCHARRLIEEKEGKLEVKYDFHFDRKYDLVIVDGPSMKVNDIRRKDGINSNVLDALPDYCPKVILVDIRKSTVDHLKEKLSRYYDCFVSDVIQRRFYFGYQYFSIFLLKS